MRPPREALQIQRALSGILRLTLYFSLGGPAFAQDPDASLKPGEPEVSLVVKTTTDLSEANDLISEFTKLNPGVAVQYSKVQSTELFEEVAKSAGTVDVVWSSAMDLQIKLANDGFAAEYRPAEAEAISSWARWKDRAYGVTAEPVVIVFNKRLLERSLVPKDHGDLLRLLTDHLSVFQGRIATYDPELSGTGLLFITQDMRVTAQTWNLVAAMGRAKVKLYSSSGPMIDRVSAGDLVLAYNVLGSYAIERAKHDSDLGVVFPSDYTLLLSRIALIPQSATQPILARRFVDYLLSRNGQALLSRHSLGSVREDMNPQIPGHADGVKALRPITLSIDLLTYLDKAKRHRFLKDWKTSLQER